MKIIQQLRHYSSTKSSFFVTTPIYYVNASPHIGHLYSSVIADAIARWQHLLNPTKEICFATGTDEHGSKIQQAAFKNNKSLPEYCRDISDKYKLMSSKFNIGYTDFIRTTEKRHIDAVHVMWVWIHDFYSIENKIDSHAENAVKPKKFYKILLDSITKEKLPDVSVSRPCTRVHWGIKVPGDETQTIYVWLDALVNYLTVAGYGLSEKDQFTKIWPADVQVVGKDILKFHAIYWPTFLMAAGLEPPKTILCHSHWTVDDQKMSKSKNNVVCPIQSSETYTTDGLRYFLLREGVAHSDGNYSEEKLRRILNAELADTLGNLLNRCCGDALNPEQIFPGVAEYGVVFNELASRVDVGKKLVESLKSLSDTCHEHYQEYNFYKVVDSVMATLHSANLFFETVKPWEMRKVTQRKQELEVTLHMAMEALRISAIILLPIIPNLSEKILDKLNVPKSERFWSNTKQYNWNDINFKSRDLLPEKIVLFQRIISPKEELKKKKKIKH
ncbi:methionyl-trna synthetase [Holotrichia oblita]|uniref:Methionyl-trna synthetase n=1 Tax=Holotrichia oblita TaxID=644536 RepID=A0ACB9T5S5_HOLOL|nr:methionyl-trna synthetase [Holotrichia oblita]